MRENTLLDTSLLLSKGTNYCLNKLKEEMEELNEAIKNNTNRIHESADVIYHLLVTLESAGIDFSDVISELKKRKGTLKKFLLMNLC